MRKTVSSTSSKKYTLASFFAGVGGIELGFENTGEFSTVYANEFDKNAQITYSTNFKDVSLDRRDIREVEHFDLPNTDVITGGFPCQAFSIAGYRKGFEDERGDLYFDLLRIIKEKQPRVIFIENVKNMVTHDHGNTFKVIRESLAIHGYHISWRVLNGSEYGNIPQNRERIYIVGFKNLKDFNKFDFPEPIELTTNLKNIIEFDKQKDEVFYYREGKQPFYNQLEKEIKSKESIYQWRRKYVRENKSGVVPTLTANMGTGGHNVPLIFTNTGIRKLTPRETFNAQGYPHEYKLPEIANSHLYKQAGNSVVVPVVQRIAVNIAKVLNKNNLPSAPHNYSDENKYAIIYVNIHSRYSGTSYVAQYAKTITEIEKFKKEKTSTLLPLLNDEDYIRLIKKRQSGEFYMIVEI